MSGTLTVANSVISATVEALYTSATQLTGYSADDAFDFDAVENGEYQMGIDGTLSAGFVYNEIPFTVTFNADSPSVQIFENIWSYEQSNRTKLAHNWTITLPNLSRRYDLKNGFMKSYKAPSGKKVLQPAVVQLVFARIEPSST
jgi:hypothetical protein